MQDNTNTKRIAKNTLMLYFRQILIMFVSFYTVREVLNVLGVEDYGIYNVVAGVVTMFSFLSGTMATASQRYFSFALGEKNQEKLYKIFISNLIIYIIIILIAVILFETIGLWFVDTRLKVPVHRFKAVYILYHFVFFTFVFSIITAPFMAIIIAHEDMHVYAYFSILEALLKLIVVFMLKLVVFDKLVLYGFLTFCVAIVNVLLYLTYCLKKYDECKFRKRYLDVNLIKEMTGFTGWTLFGQISSISRNQAVTILLNQTFNPVVVTARGLAVTIANYVNIFANNFNTGIYPAIIKEYASGNNHRMMRLVFKGCKMTSFLIWIFTLPLILQMENILKFWLKSVPLYTVLFTKLALVEVLITSLSMPITTAARAPGNMKVYELILGSLQLLVFVFSYILLNMNFEAYWVFIVAIGVNFIMFFVRLIIVKFLVDLKIVLFMKAVFSPVIFTITVSFLISYFFCCYTPDTLFFIFIKFLFSIFTSFLCIFYIGMTKLERFNFISMITRKIKKI